VRKILRKWKKFKKGHYVLNYEELLEKSKMPSLKVRRLRSIAIESLKLYIKKPYLFI